MNTTEQSKTSLNQKIIFYDGICNLCHFTVRLIKKMDKKGIIRFLPLQSPESQSILSELQNIPDSVVLYSEGKYFTKMDAIIETARISGGVLHLLRIITILPISFRNKLYDFVASRRYNWFGKRESCELPQNIL